MSVRRSILLTALAVLASGALAVAPAGAAASFKTTVIVSLKFPAFHGNLASKRNGCVAQRTVKLYRKKDGKLKMLGTDKSDSNGKWAVPIGKKIPSGQYFAKAVFRGNCRAGKSQLLPIE